MYVAYLYCITEQCSRIAARAVIVFQFLSSGYHSKYKEYLVTALMTFYAAQ